MEQLFSAWRVGERGRKSLPDVENQGAYRLESCLCWHAQAFPGQHVNHHSTVTHVMQKNGVANEDARCFASAADQRAF